MLTTKKPKLRKKIYRLRRNKTLKEISLFHFPSVRGLEDISERLGAVEADSLFSALMHAFSLRSIESEQEAQKAERVLEYLERAFEQDPPLEVVHFRQVLLMLITAFDEQLYTRAAGNLKSHEFLKALLDEEGLSQKDLVPDCFKSESQVSEFLHQRKGRKILSYTQASALGKRFHVDPLNFLA